MSLEVHCVPRASVFAADRRATAAWTISTETDAVGIKKGNYVQGTVCQVLRKRLSAEPGFLDEIYPMVEDEVRRQIDSMQALDEGSEPNSDPAARALLNQLPRLLQGYGAAYSQGEFALGVIVVCDLDDRCLTAFRRQLDDVLTQCNPAPATRFCIAVKELESWYLGDFTALKKTYPRVTGKLPKRHPDETQQGTWEHLADIVLKGGAGSLRRKGGSAIGDQKHLWAQQICPHLDLQSNRSPSFQYFCRAIRELTRE